MANTPFESRDNEWIGDLVVWRQNHCEDNASQLSRLRRNLRRVRENELTPRQREVVDLYYDSNLKISEIARQLQVNRSTVSRTLRRARDRLRHYLQYSF